MRWQGADTQQGVPGCRIVGVYSGVDDVQPAHAKAESAGEGAQALAVAAVFAGRFAQYYAEFGPARDSIDIAQLHIAHAALMLARVLVLVHQPVYRPSAGVHRSKPRALRVGTGCGGFGEKAFGCAGVAQFGEARQGVGAYRYETIACACERAVQAAVRGVEGVGQLVHGVIVERLPLRCQSLTSATGLPMLRA